MNTTPMLFEINCMHGSSLYGHGIWVGDKIRSVEMKLQKEYTMQLILVLEFWLKIRVF